MPIAPLPHALDLTVVGETRRLYREKGPIYAIKYLRERTRWSLKEAKDAVEIHLITDEDRAARQSPEMTRTMVNLVTFLSRDGTEAWTSGTYQNLPCGCEVDGNGTIPHPLTVKHCNGHAATKLPDPIRAERIERELRSGMINASDRARRAYVFCPESARGVCWAAYEKARRHDGYADRDTPDGPEPTDLWIGPIADTITLSRVDAEAALALIEDMSRFVGTMVLQDYARFNEVPIALRRALGVSPAKEI